MELLYMSLGGSLVICAIFLVRLLLQNRVHRTVWLILWAIAVLRLVLPFTVASSFSVFNLPVFRAQPAQAAVTTQQPQTAASAEVQQAVPPTEQPRCSTAEVLTAAWLTGSVLAGGYFVFSHLRARRRYRFALPVKVQGVEDTICIKELEGLLSPLTYGLLRPVILLPCGRKEDTDNCRRVLAHELAHIRHGDVAYKAVLLLTVALHWFNPFVWLMLFTASEDMEMRCDAEALQALDGDKTAYAKTLIQAEEAKLRGYLQTGFSFSSTEQRLRAMIQSRTSTAWSICIGAILTVLLLAVFCTGQLVPQAQALTPDRGIVLQMPPMLETQQQTQTPPIQTEEATVLPETGPTEPTETEQTAAPTETEPTEPAQKPTEQAAAPTEEPTVQQLPTEYTVPGPVNITVHCGTNETFFMQYPDIVTFSCDGGVSIETSCGIDRENNEMRHYAVTVCALEFGTYQIYCTTSFGLTFLWATVTVIL